MSDNKEHICCICGKKFTGWGNDPWPVVKDEDARCCDECDWTVVLYARLADMKKAKEVLK